MKHLLSFNENLNPRPYLSISRYVEIRDYIHDVSQDIKDEGFSIFNYRNLDNNGNIANFSIEFRNIFYEGISTSKINNFKWEDIKDTVNHLISYINEETNNKFTVQIEYTKPNESREGMSCTLNEFLKRVDWLGSINRLSLTFLNKSSKTNIGNSMNSRKIIP